MEDQKIRTIILHTGYAEEDVKMTQLKPGKYRHYKGGIYEVLFLAYDAEETEDETDLPDDGYAPTTVVYKSADGRIWVRSITEFLAADVEIEVSRFERIED